MIDLLNLNLSSSFPCLGQDNHRDMGEWMGGWMGWMIFMMMIWIIFAVILGVWVYRDAESRGANGALWLIIVLFTMILGLIIWLLVRPPKKELEKRVIEKVLICPYCRTENAPNARFCSNCSASLE